MDFDTLVERRGTASYKWDRYGPDVLPFWVADMDLPSPPAVSAALQARAAHGIYGYALTPESLVSAIQGHLLAAHGWAVAPTPSSTCPASCRRSTWPAAPMRRPARPC